ncbi:MAG: hypothetical protein ACJAQT_002085 [Akkermansiaceae bacterium]|jgi:hypothetical protein
MDVEGRWRRAREMDDTSPEAVESEKEFDFLATEDLGDGEDELAVGDFVANGGCDPLANGAGVALVAGGAEVAALAGEGEEAFVATIRALEARSPQRRKDSTVAAALGRSEPRNLRWCFS